MFVDEADLQERTQQHRKDRIELEAALRAPVTGESTEVIRRLAEKKFDSWCDSKVGECECAYCTARRILARETS